MRLTTTARSFETMLDVLYNKSALESEWKRELFVHAYVGGFGSSLSPFSTLALEFLSCPRLRWNLHNEKGKGQNGLGSLLRIETSGCLR
jgi:hypothetical protein